MKETESKVMQQIVEKITASTNILVTVNLHPTVDELSAALGLTIFLNKLGKHAIAVFSGNIPPAINFLEPDKVFEAKADSLRDFIIALDKEKADHLRYKVEGDLVKIFITPYHTTITEYDLEFSQGDFNVELVLALGVASQENLDIALSSEEKILHDVTIATLSAGEQSSQLGSVDWRDESASSLSEMVAIISDSLKSEGVTLDKQIATALLTGIVSATDRFSNPKTTSRVMSTAASLMAAGADQQLVAAKLQEAHAIDCLPGSTASEAQKSESSNSEPQKDVVEPEAVPSRPDVLQISHEPEPVVEPEAVDEPESKVPETNPAPAEPSPIAPEAPVVKVPSFQEISTAHSTAPREEADEEPLLGGILNATSDQAAEDARRQLDEQQNKTILSHTYLAGSESTVPPINGTEEAEDTKVVDIFAEPSVAPSIPTGVDLPLPPPVPDFSTLPPVSTIPPIPPVGDINLPPAPETPSSDQSTIPPQSTLPPSDKNDPSQFQIPM